MTDLASLLTPSRRLALAALVLATGCRGCFEAAAPDFADYARLGDPYEGVPAEGSVQAFDRAVAVIGGAAHTLKYGDVPVQVLRRRQGEGWVLRLTLLVAKGDLEALDNAHSDLVETWATGFSVPKDLKLQLRQGESRLGDFGADPRTELERRAAYVAEITWALYLVGTLTADGGT